MDRTSEPALGSLLYEAGIKRDKPIGPIIISWVYCGRVKEEGNEYFLLVEFSRWWHLKRLGLPIEGKHGLKVSDVAQIYDGRDTWEGVRNWCQSQQDEGLDRD